MMWKEMLKDKKGVSPVIGVILMVAITVILAAVIASFTFGMSTKIRAAPNAQLMLSDHEDIINITGDADDLVYISHMGGDTLKCDELKIKVTNKGTGTSYVLTWDSDSSCFKDSEDNLRLYVKADEKYGNKYYITTSGLLQVGDTATLSESGSGKDFVKAVPATLEIQIIHIPTGTIIYTGEIVLMQ